MKLRRLPLPRRNNLFAILMGCSILLILLPVRWTGWLKSVRQVLVPFQHGVSALTGGSSVGGPASVSGEEHRRVVDELESTRNELIALHALVREMEAEQPTVATIIQKLLTRTASREGRLVPARIIAHDPAAWRDAPLLSRGRQSGVRDGAWVTSCRDLDAGEEDGMRQGMLVLAREYLIGQIAEVTPYSSRLILLSDVETRIQVWIGRIEDKRFRVLPSPDALREPKRWADPGAEASFLLAGRGNGRMVVEQVHEDYVKKGVIAVDDLVVSAGTTAELPVVMVIGRIAKIEDDPAQRQLRQLQVRCPVDPSRLRWVYAVDAPPRDRMPDR